MELVHALTLHIEIDRDGVTEMHHEGGASVRMIPFGGSADGPFFSGMILPGGVDTQVIDPDGWGKTISARYLLEGTDNDGKSCRLSIENNGYIHPTDDGGTYFKVVPTMHTDSAALAFFETDLFVCEATLHEKGPEIEMYWVR